jgi:hypothetical protein
MRALIATGLIVAAAAAQAGDHRVEIDYYTHHYDGADIALSRFHCGAARLRNAAERAAGWPATAASATTTPRCRSRTIPAAWRTP